MNEALILALADKRTEAKLRSICNVLRMCGKDGTTEDFSRIDENGKPGRQKYLDLVTYGCAGQKLTVVDRIINRQSK